LSNTYTAENLVPWNVGS